MKTFRSPIQASRGHRSYSRKRWPGARARLQRSHPWRRLNGRTSRHENARRSHILQQHSWHGNNNRRSCLTPKCSAKPILESSTHAELCWWRGEHLLDNIHLIFGGGGTGWKMHWRDSPDIAGEYFMMGPMPAYGLYARNVRGLTLHNIRFQVSTLDMRVLHLSSTECRTPAYRTSSVEGNPSAESALRFINTQDAGRIPRMLTLTAAFLQVEGASED